MLKITKIQESERDVLLKLEGKIRSSGRPCLMVNAVPIFGGIRSCSWIVPMLSTSMGGESRFSMHFPIHTSP